MSDKLRSVNTRFWEDPFIEGLNPTEKLLFLYLLTNPLTNLMGIYEITIKRISYDTGMTKESIEKGLKGFEKVRKALIIDNYLILPNFLKNQSLNENMKIGVVKLFKSLPNSLKETLLGNAYQIISNDYQTLRNGLLKLNGIEREIEIEKEIEIINIPIPDFLEFKNYALENDPKVNISKLELKYKAWVVAGWKDGNNKMIKNWKSKLLNTLPYIEKLQTASDPKMSTKYL